MVGTTHNGRAMTGWRRQLMGTMLACAGMFERKDPYTAGHVQRVTGFSVLLGMELKLAPRELTDLWLAAALHDVGKMFVSRTILGKPGPLTQRETEAMRAHPEIGARILSRVHGMRRAAGGVRHHHERYDGRGYPDRLRGTEIPLSARIIAVADTYDAMTSHRPYRAALSPHEAALEITHEAGKQLCPSVVLAFQNLYEAGRFATVP